MNETLTLSLAILTGAVLGVMFFGGLWWTVQKGMRSGQPAFWFLGSFLIRTFVVVAGFYLVGAGQWERLLGCLFGFAAARLAVTWLTRNPSRGTP